jgi:hypothetical protein
VGDRQALAGGGLVVGFGNFAHYMHKYSIHILPGKVGKNKMLSGKTVYVMTPKHCYGSVKYQENKKLMILQFPTAKFLWPDDLYFDRYDWLHNFPGYLDKADCSLVIPDWRGMVGCGVYSEIRAFENVGKPLYCLTPNDIVSDFTVEVVNERDWKLYAKVIVKARTKRDPLPLERR